MRLRLLPLLALLAQPAGAAAPIELAGAIAREAADRESLAAEAHRLKVEAAALAEQVSSLKSVGGPSRADGELARRLRDFDRLAERLDGLERRIEEADRRLARRRAEFEAAADIEERRLQGRAREEGALAVATPLEALLRARRDVAARTTTAAFRPPLEVVLDPLDGPAELDAKRALIDGERGRLAVRLRELRGEENLVATRLGPKRQWAGQLAAARRDAAGDLELLDRGYEDAERGLHDLAARLESLTRERRALEAADTRLQARGAEAEARLHELRKTR